MAVIHDLANYRDRMRTRTMLRLYAQGYIQAATDGNPDSVSEGRPEPCRRRGPKKRNPC